MAAGPNRLENGTDSSASVLRFFWAADDLMSMTGDSPVTTTVSLTDPTSSVNGNVTVSPRRMVTFSRLMGLNPWSSMVTV